jgi:spore germination protein GerM
MRTVVWVGLFALLLALVGVLLYLNFVAPPRPPALAGTPAGTPAAGAQSPTPARGRVRIVLYFQGADVGLLFPEEREVDVSADSSARARRVLEELARGSTAELLPTLPAGTHVREVYFDSHGVAHVDFSREIRDNHPGGSAEELLTVESVVHSLSRNVPEVRAVHFLVNGRAATTLAGHVDLTLPLAPDAQWLGQ